jgi:hypothetical protein
MIFKDFFNNKRGALILPHDKKFFIYTWNKDISKALISKVENAESLGISFKESLLKENLNLIDLECLVIYCGPKGSFTSLRLAAAFGNGLLSCLQMKGYKILDDPIFIQDSFYHNPVFDYEPVDIFTPIYSHAIDTLYKKTFTPKV